MLRKRIKSFGYAIKGLEVFFKTQIHAQIHATATVLVVIAGFYFHITTTEWCLIVLASASVLCAEAMNTAIELLTDLVSPDYHTLAGKVKDVAAGAVLLIAIGAAVIGILIFFPYLCRLFLQ